jgi:fructose-1,6-bisphosphatase I
MTTLNEFLDGWAEGSAERAPVAATVSALVSGAIEVSRQLARSDGTEEQAAEAEHVAEVALIAALGDAPVAWVASERGSAPVALRDGAPLAVAIDPLDGSGNVAIDGPSGTIFSILAMPADPGGPVAVFLQPGERQIAAGFVLHSQHTALVLTLRQGTHLFILDRDSGEFRLARRDLRVPEGRRLYAINAANYRYWDPSIRGYVDDCIAGEAGPRGADFNMRWMGCATGELMRILVRGGVYLYPGDTRAGYRQGRLRLVFAANPLALILEQAGGAATSGADPILGLVPQTLHQRVPLVFGSCDKVERVAGYHTGRLPSGEHSPLFGKRGLFRV